MTALTESTALIAWWGAGLSTLLAVVRLYELWRDRFRVEVSYNFAGNDEVGNEVLIRNLSGRPFILAHWELFYASRYSHQLSVEAIEDRGFDAGDFKVDPYATVTLRFSGASYFSWSAKTLRGRRIYIRLHLAGRRPLVRLVYRPDR